MSETLYRINWKTHWCQRNKCQGSGKCQYVHNCKLMTIAEAEAAKAEWEFARARREDAEKQEAINDEMLRRNRNNRIEAMLDAHGLSLYDLEEWVKEITR